MHARPDGDRVGFQREALQVGTWLMDSGTEGNELVSCRRGIWFTYPRMHSNVQPCPCTCGLWSCSKPVGR